MSLLDNDTFEAGMWVLLIGVLIVIALVIYFIIVKEPPHVAVYCIRGYLGNYRAIIHNRRNVLINYRIHERKRYSSTRRP